MADEVRRVPVQTADKVAEVSGAHSRQSCGGFRYKSLPRSSKLLGITHEFIFSYFFLIFFFSDLKKDTIYIYIYKGTAFGCLWYVPKIGEQDAWRVLQQSARPRT